MFSFHYRPDDGAYLGTSPITFDPLEPGRKLVPAWATDQVPPPVAEADEWPFFVQQEGQALGVGSWELRPIVPAAAGE